MKKLIQVITNWHYTNENGEDYVIYESPHEQIKNMTYHEPKGDGDKHYVDIEYSNGKTIREFNLNSVLWEETKWHTKKPLKGVEKCRIANKKNQKD